MLGCRLLTCIDPQQFKHEAVVLGFVRVDKNFRGQIAVGQSLDSSFARKIKVRSNFSFNIRKIKVQSNFSFNIIVFTLRDINCTY